MRPTLSSYPYLAGGKIRDLYAIDDEHMLLVASDRISAYDHVLSTPIPDKGRVLTAMSFFFFDVLGGTNHLAGEPDDARIPDEVRGRAMVVKRLKMIPIECVARGYLVGSGLRDYQKTGAVCGIKLPAGLVEGSKLVDPIFTPATKADIGEHDLNIDFQAVVDQLGPELAVKLREDTLDIYFRASSYAEARGVILADTKFEFGLDKNNNLVLADEVLTPDSSRYWPADSYKVGAPQPSFDKQYVRDWLTGPDSGWDRDADGPPPPLPDEVVAATRARYIEAYETISGLSFADWVR
ncbi:phosphoribosylaminoimidazolesuccinocarboxamide synthase [Antrihabitans stalactiti]|uniref:Phosphoribosylaminoimidazole-succinocarboxamide synthase n=1 Tax=Antrihabitans stalactiti TaxID=2584121 RepID=A0A848KJ72_9NOCA|nr:phosphoribosylaminoimidazolesuccinocarboxamide synthase [Antrihabitans stalactiti]